MTTRADRQRARALGKKGGRSTSPAKVAAARRNLALARLARRYAAGLRPNYIDEALVFGGPLSAAEIADAKEVADTVTDTGETIAERMIRVYGRKCHAGCSLAPGHDGPCFVPAKG